MIGMQIQAVHPQKWSPGFTPTSVSLAGGTWRPPPLPMGPAEKVQETFAIAMSPNPDAAVAQVALGQGAVSRAAAAGTIALFTLPAAATAYVGYRLGTLDKGFPSILGYVVGTLGALGVLAGVLGMLGAITLPSGMAGSAQPK